MGKIHSSCTAFFLIVIFAFSSCNNKTTETIVHFDGFEDKPLPTHFQNLYPGFDKHHLDSLFRAHIQSDSTLFPFYAQDSCRLVWFDEALKANKLNRILGLIEHVDRHGLTPEYFDIDDIVELSTAIDSGRIHEDSIYVNLIRFDCLMSKLLITYITGMNYGFLRPDSLFAADDYSIEIYSPDSLFKAKMYKDIKADAVGAMYNALPTDSVYLAMQDAYTFWKEKRGDKLKEIKPKGPKLAYALNEKSPEIEKVAERLMWTGDYTPNRELEPDTLNRTFTKQMLAALNKFRYTNSYPDDKKDIDPITINALNRDADYYLRKIAANMERYRWKRGGVRYGKHIEVNIAAFKLYATQPNEDPLIMKVCVGKTKHKTPTLLSALAYLNLNPVWNVPKSIAKNEVFPLQRRDTSYLRKHNMRLYKGGEEVDYTTIDWKNERISERVYYVRQDPGPSNSLGRIKFMFANSFSVYLHDTPAQRAFTYFDRAVSHGCVRVQQPVDLAFFCLSPEDDMYKDRLLYSIDKTPKTKEAKLLAENEELEKLEDIIRLHRKPKISLAIDYYTIYMHPNSNKLFYADDVYGYDDIILSALAGSKPNIEKSQNKDELY
ncbi:L,D-transpeptidase family protein [Dysgonomonas sp. 25]|uniref:L,D-transpeptidase family protein n=1 Tax=Dysgonomonas sp. 25 TaxID=2302933 RepID=UPI0013D1A80C|nr:L,D-transpeptidase family protein [Dysgonomonas sp. 25]NDV67634.1 L,D-transpeptidase [Dysgonomonas sp. 25]